MPAVLLVAAWAYADRREGEFLDVAVWLFGEQFGFDLGLIGEMTLQSLDVIRRDIAQMQTALHLKGIKPGFRTIVPLAVNLIVLQLRRTEDQARLLAVRGYTKGGRICPKFRTGYRDALSAVFAAILVIAALVAVRDVFIVLQ
ncbi:transmembrane component bion of energizing module of biotin ecf transporter [hydrocarbon metagenome]|uniref:Transmembrane component bion of energizing module of biotin ecf transporter n=1 Tax=hydrocarbon metagenome TaxID=938273 RepID=A0A0W8FIN2_9ZZZZ